ncbi:MAG TPA: hypothetical protein VLC28_13050 [Flavitalea sp.]|nr:hypothetical protein [Flavitalea sp.]
MRIAFIHQGLAHLPELEAYTRFFESRGHQTFIGKQSQQPPFKPDVEWHFMGMGGARMFPGTKLIHEYASASVPVLAHLKDNVKRWFNSKPDFRIFLNDQVRKSIGFNDSIPFGYRDMGIDIDGIENDHEEKKCFDFIYPGSVEPYKFFQKLLWKFTTDEFKASKLLVISNIASGMRSEWSKYDNIEFRAPLTNREVIALIRQSKYGINFRPPVAPFTFQTATKVLEYAACKVPVITTPSEWLSNFTKKNGGNYFILSPDLTNLTYRNLVAFDFQFPEVKHLTWQQQIIGSGVCRYLEINES